LEKKLKVICFEMELKEKEAKYKDFNAKVQKLIQGIYITKLTIDVCCVLSRFWECNAFWSIVLPLRFERILKQITHMWEYPLCSSCCIYEPLDNIC